MNKRRIWLAFAALMAVALGLWGCNKSDSNPYGSTSSNSSNTSPNTVTMMNIAFNPGTQTVTRGTTVTWKNNDGIAHTSTSDTGAWDTGNIPAGGSTTTTFNSAGTFKYHCTIHGTAMSGTIVVQ